MEWSAILQDVYGFESAYHIAIGEDGKALGVLPGFYINSFLFGKKITTQPFNFYGGPIFQNEETGRALLNFAFQEIEDKGNYTLELKSSFEFSEKILTGVNLGERNDFVTFLIDLEVGGSHIERGYKKRFREKIRNLRKKRSDLGLRFRSGRDEKDLKVFYNLLTKQYRNKHLMLPQPYKLFYSVMERLGRKNMADLMVIDSEGKIIGGIIILKFKNTVYYLWGASDHNRYSHLSPLTLLLDEAIKSSSLDGFKYFDLGITSLSHKGLLFFKSRWGGEMKPLFYYYGSVKDKKSPELDYYESFRTMRKLFRFVPLPVIKATSPFITRHLA